MKKLSSYMDYAIELAKRGYGMVEPNPMVGCVILNADGDIIGEGWHKEYGKAHAEINALEDCRRRGKSPRGSTVLVTLEPCSHHGKTPPCAEALIEAKVGKLVAAMVDPSSKVSGRGIRKLEQAGIRVSVGTGEKKARLLNSSFIKYSQTGLPWVLLKWAQSIDGFLASGSDNPEDRWLSCEASRKDVHKLRRSCDAIMTGVGTALADNPLLTARPDKGRSPHRFVLDSRLRIDTSLKMFQTTDIAPLTVITTSDDLARIDEIEKTGAVVMAVEAEKSGRCSLPSTLKLLGEMGMQRLMVEGGPALLSEFIRQSLADEAQVYIAPKLLAGTGAASISDALKDISSLALHHSETTTFDNDAKITARFRNIAEL